MLIALETPQIVLMLLGFAGMVGFAGLALWLWWRQRGQAQARSSAHVAAASRSTPRPASPSAPAAEHHQGEHHEPTEFIALPGQRELDSPLGSAYATEIVSAMPESDGEPEVPEDKTEFVAPRLGDESEHESDAVERTAMIPSALVLERQRAAAASRPAPAPMPVDDATEFIKPPPAFAAPPTLIPTSIPIATPPIATLPISTPSPPSIDLAEHFSLAAEAYAQLGSATTSASLEVWRGHLEVLASIPGEQLYERVRLELEGAPDHRWVAALLALLHNKSWAAKRAFPQLLTELDPTRRDAALRVLRSWDDPRAQPIAAAGLSLADASGHATWLECFADRGWDPGVEVIEAALRDGDPRIVCAGLRALPHCEAALSFEPKLASHLFAADPSVRIQAIETSLLLFANNSAWLVCHQLARNPSFPIAAELVGLLGTDLEIRALGRALDASPTPTLVRGLALSGRRVALDACVARFDDEDPDLRAAARAGLELAAARPFESAPDAQAWLEAHPVGVGQGGSGSSTGTKLPARLLGGATRSRAQVLAILADADAPLRHVIARELRVRSRGRLHLDVDTLPDAWRRQLEQLGAATSFAAIDFERGFPWTR